MSKPSAIFLARTGNLYRIKTPDWQRSVPADEIKNILALAWMQYGDNPGGCEVVGQTADLDDYIQELKSGRRGEVINMRVSAVEKLAVEEAARKGGHASVSAYLLALHRVHGPKSTS